MSFLDEKGRPTVVERATILPPQSAMGAIDDARRKAEIHADDMFGKYEVAVDNESAYEIINAEKKDAEERAAEEAREQAEEKERAAAEKEKEKAERAKEKEKAKKTSTRKKSTLSKVADSAMSSVGRELGRQIRARTFRYDKKTVLTLRSRRFCTAAPPVFYKKAFTQRLKIEFNNFVLHYTTQCDIILEYSAVVFPIQRHDTSERTHIE